MTTCRECICYEKCKSSKLDFAESAEPTHICQYFKKPENNWVDFKEEKPKKNGYYFCYHMTSKCGDKEQWQMQMLYWEDSLWLYHHSTFKTADYVSHWMSLPEPPTKKE